MDDYDANKMDADEFISGVTKAIEDGKGDIREGKKLLNKVGTKRGLDVVNEAVAAGGLVPFRNANDPLCLIDRIPLKTKEAILGLPAEEQGGILNSYLNTQLARVTVLQREAILNQPTQTKMLEKLMTMITLEELTFE